MKVTSFWKVALGLALAAVVAWGASPVMGAGGASEVVEHSDSVEAGETAGEAAEAPAETGGIEPPAPWTDPDRADKLSRLDQLERRRAELRRELAEVRRELSQVNRELRALRRELWPEGSEGRGSDADGEADAPERRRAQWMTEEEWERLRRDWQERTERFMEQLHERLRTMGEDVLPWVPDAVVEGLAERTGYTPEQVRELIRTGQWDQLFRRLHGRAESGDAPGPAPDARGESDGADGAGGAPGEEDAEAGPAPQAGGRGGADAAVNGTPIS